MYEQFARVGKVLASPRRLELLDLLSQGPKSVETLAQELAASVANVSQHLRILAQAQLVTTQKSGTFVIYRLANPAIVPLLDQIHAVSEGLFAEVREWRRTYLTDRDALAPVTADELRRRMTAGDVCLIDVRPVSEYEAGHLPGALSVPVSEIATHFQQWQDPRPVVAYCRGRYCLYARDAVEALAKQGVSAQRTDVGVWDWPVLDRVVESPAQKMRTKGNQRASP